MRIIYNIPVENSGNISGAFFICVGRTQISGTLLLFPAAQNNIDRALSVLLGLLDSQGDTANPKQSDMQQLQAEWQAMILE